MDGSGVIGGLNVDFKDSLGYVVQADWRIMEKMNLGVRYILLDYELNGSNTKIDANSFGIVFSGSF